MDGRIDDPKTGWKGKGVWSAYAGRATNHIEGGKGTKPKGGQVPALPRSAGEVNIARRWLLSRKKRRHKDGNGGDFRGLHYGWNA